MLLIYSLHSLKKYQKTEFLHDFNYWLSIFIYVACYFITYISIEEIYWLGKWKNVGISITLDNLELVRYVSLIFGGYIYIMRAKIKFLSNEILYPLLMTLYFSIVLMLFSNDVFNFFVSCELGGVTVYILSTCNFDNKKYIKENSTKSFDLSKDIDKKIKLGALNYLIYGSIGSGFILLGIGFLILDCHSFVLTELNSDLTRGLVLLIVGLFVKLNIWPLDFIANKAYSKLDNLTLVLIQGVYFIPFSAFLYKLNLQNLLLNISDFICIGIFLKIIQDYLKSRNKAINLKETLINYMVFSNFIIILATSLSKEKFIYYLICESLSKIFIFLALETTAQSKILRFSLTYYVLCVLNSPLTSIFWAKIDILLLNITKQNYYLPVCISLGSFWFGFSIWQLVKYIIFNEKKSTIEQILDDTSSKQLSPDSLWKINLIGKSCDLNHNVDNLKGMKTVTFKIELAIVLIILSLILLQTTYN